MTYNAPTPEELREAARSSCEGQPESDLQKHPAWRAADFIEQEGYRLLNGTGTSQPPTGLMEAVTQKNVDVRPGLELTIAHCHALQQQGLTRSRTDVLANDFQNFQPGLEWAAARCKALHSQGFEQSRHDVLIRTFEVRIMNQDG